jgi:hypothetical protein
MANQEHAALTERIPFGGQPVAETHHRGGGPRRKWQAKAASGMADQVSPVSPPVKEAAVSAEDRSSASTQERRQRSTRTLDSTPLAKRFKA